VLLGEWRADRLISGSSDAMRSSGRFHLRLDGRPRRRKKRIQTASSDNRKVRAMVEDEGVHVIISSLLPFSPLSAPSAARIAAASSLRFDACQRRPTELPGHSNLLRQRPREKSARSTWIKCLAQPHPPRRATPIGDSKRRLKLAATICTHFPACCSPISSSLTCLISAPST
jgi:hypothetical protein